MDESLYYVGVALAVWFVLAYLALPTIWRRAERQKMLAGFEMVTRTKQGIAGDPINFGLVGDEAQVLWAFQTAGWTLADSVTLRSSIKIAGSVALRRPDPAAPVSPLFYDKRVEDLAFELPDGVSAAHRHHIRLWRVGDNLFQNRPLWLASASYDRSVGLSHLTLQVTHHIGADLDAERDFVGKSLGKAGVIESFFQIQGVGPTLRGRNGGGDRYFTDGDALIGVVPENGLLRAEPVAPPDNPPHIDLQSAIVHALGGR
ncbi:LssY C-terminal domain-containing protein [uncultured Rhodoblastus sp.]|uniref:LssY C-terminal domain-containing protein n=1 Tax=uncultured Rhodoblastus sp. TaxID=543037 RepID=UPI0025F650F4|nr:LssY C-terminal domain-containing protein [uncultured Rhodoblastus sp.]